MTFDLNLFENWSAIARVALIAVVAYVALIVFVRVSGKRTLSQLNAFDLIVTIALGSMLSATILDRNLPLLEGLTGIGLLIAMQVILAWLTARFKWADRLVKAEPTRLVTDGVLDRAAMKKVDITEEEIAAALRQGHWDRLADVKTVMLETNGGLTVVYRAQLSAR